jgi:hypothetical protein
VVQPGGDDRGLPLAALRHQRHRLQRDLRRTGRTYTLKDADRSHSLRVRVTGTGQRVLDADHLGRLLRRDLDTGDDRRAVHRSRHRPSALPGAVVDRRRLRRRDDRRLGRRLEGPTTDFLRRWVRCDADGTACTYIQKSGRPTPRPARRTPRPEDLGYTLRLRVTADVNFDFTQAPPTGGDGTDNHLPHAVEVDTPPSAVVGYRPVPRRWRLR